MQNISVSQKSLPKLKDDGFLERLLSECREEFGNEALDKWLINLAIFSESESEIIFSAPSKLIRDWIIREFIERKPKSNKKNLVNLVQSLRPQVKRIAVIYVADPQSVSATTANFVPANSGEQKLVNLSKYDNVFAFGTELNQRFTFQNFVSAKYNKLALSMAKIVSGADIQTKLFDDKIPLFIHGGVGIGKTHLAQAIALGDVGGDLCDRGRRLEAIQLLL